MVELRNPGGTADNRLTNHSLLYGSLAAVAIAGPLLCMMGFTLLATTTLLVVTSPLLLLISPLLILVGFIIAAAMAGFAAAGVMAIAGLWTMKWLVSAVRKGRADAVEWEENLVTVSGRRLKEHDVDFGGYAHKKLQYIPGENGDHVEVRRK